MAHKKKILVVGAAGFIGNACYHSLADAHDVTGADTVTAVGLTTLGSGDELAILIKNGRFDAIVNCAGSSNIQQSFTDPVRDYDLNARLVQQLLDAILCTDPRTRLINLSSAAVYGNPDALPVAESALPQPLSPYGRHKLEAERFVADYFTRHGIGGLSLRIFSAYGEGLRRQFFYDLSQKLASNSATVTLFGTGRESRDFIHITDIVSAIDTLLQNATFDGSVYNLASGRESFIDETAYAYARMAGFTGDILFSNQVLDGYPTNWRADISKLSALGFEPKIPLEEGMQRYAGWVKLKQYL